MPGLTPNGLPPQRNDLMQHARSDGDDSIPEQEKIEKQSTSIEQKYRDLQLAHENLQLVHNKLQLAHKSLGGELRRVQELDFKARKKDLAEPHGTVSQRFLDVFRMSTDWARDYFRININSFCLDDHELFKTHLGAVSWEGTDWTRKRELNVSHLVQAVVAEVLARRILLSSFAGCSSSFRHEFGQLYEEMRKENKSQAQKWLATALATYWQCGEWASFGSTVPPEPISRYREQYYEEIAKEIDLMISPIARKHFPNRNDHDERFRRSMRFIEAAGNLAIILGKQAAELKIMDKSWFEGSGRGFVCDDERMKGRFAEEDEDAGEGFRVDIVLRPGFLKYGNDDGENLEKYAVWIPAMLDLGEPGGSAHPQSTPLVGFSPDDLSMDNGSSYQEVSQSLPGDIEYSGSQPTPEDQTLYQREPSATPTQPKVRDSFPEKLGFGGFLSSAVAKVKGMQVWKKSSSLFGARRTRAVEGWPREMRRRSRRSG